MAIYSEDNQHSDGSDSIAYTPQYFSVHIFFSRNEGYSIPVKIVSEDVLDEDTDEETIIQHCVEQKLFSEEGDEHHVDSIYEIDLKEYKEMKK